MTRWTKLPRIVVIGNGAAAIHAIRAAREAGFSGDIHQVSDVDGPAFNPMLSPYYLKGRIPWDRCFPFGKDFYQRHDILCHFGSPVEFLDPVEKEIRTADGERLSYDRCLIATGADPVIPPVPGLSGSSRALPLRSPGSARTMERAIASAKNVVVLGASLIGLKVAEILRKNGVEVILLDVVSQVLPHGAHPLTSRFLEEYFSRKGVDIRLGCTLEGLEEVKGAVFCYFPESIVEKADYVAVCTGIRPNIHFISSPRKVDLDRAILVDDSMSTSVSDLYAAGDVCQALNRLSGTRQWMGTWANACYQGRTAGCNMAGQPTRNPGAIPQNVSPFFDWIYAQMGDVLCRGQNLRIISYGNPFKGAYGLLVFDEGVLVGANLINGVENAGRLKTAMVQKRIWGESLLASLERGMGDEVGPALEKLGL